MPAADYEKQLAALEKKKAAIAAKEKQIKAKMSGTKRAREDHAKMVIGGALFGVLKKHGIPEDRKQLRIYGNAIRDVLQASEATLVERIEARYQKLLLEQTSSEQKPTAPELPQYPD